MLQKLWSESCDPFYFNPRIAHVFLHTRLANWGGVKYTPRVISGSRALTVLGHYGQNSNGYTRVFGAQLFNGVVLNATGSRIV